MKKFKNYITKITIVIFALIYSQYAIAISSTPGCTLSTGTPTTTPIDYYCDNSCISNAMMSYATNNVSSITNYSYYDGNFNMITAEANRPISSLDVSMTDNAGNPLKSLPVPGNSHYLTDRLGNICTNSTSSPCTTTNIGTTTDGCAIPTNDVMFYYNNILYTLPAGGYSSGATTSNIAGNSATSSSSATSFSDATLRAIGTTDNICVEIMTVIGWVPLGCKARYTAYTINTNNTSNTSCSTNTKSIFPITGKVVECVSGAINNILLLQSNTGINNFSTLSLGGFQNGMRNAVMGLLTIYFIAFGIRIVLGNEVPSKAELFMFIIKFVLVIYFSVGFSNNGVINLNNTTNNLKSTTNGVQDIIIPGFQALTLTLSQLVMSSTSNCTGATSSASNSLCYYNPSSYAAGYGFLSMFDAIDCRIAYYLGFLSANGIASDVVLVVTIFITGFFFALLSGQLMFTVFTIVFAVLFLSIIVFFLNTYVVSLVASAIVAYFAPLFVPMALFKVTKGYYDSWIKLLLSFSLQPVVMTGFIALMITIMDQIIYGNCCWTQNSSGLWNISLPYISPPYSTDNCTNSLGYLMYFNPSSVASTTLNLFIATIPGAYLVDNNIMQPLFLGTLFCFLFYYMAQTISSFASDLVGGPSLGDFAGVKPQDLFNSAAKSAAKNLPSLPKGSGGKTGSGAIKGSGGKTGSGAIR